MAYITKLPFEGKIKITYPYGVKDSAYTSGYHQGTDMVGLSNKNVYSITNGVVSYAGWENASNRKQGFGQYVSIKFDQNANGFKKVFFAHLESINVKVGQNVGNATVIGKMGSTGFSTGPHTHIEIREYNNSGKLLKILNSANWMGVPNNYGTIDSANYRIETGTSNNSYTTGNYKTNVVMRVRDGAGTNYRQKGYNELTADGKKNALANGCYKAGTVFTALEIINNADGSVWARGLSGYVCIKDNTQVYCQKV